MPFLKKNFNNADDFFIIPFVCHLLYNVNNNTQICIKMDYLLYTITTTIDMNYSVFDFWIILGTFCEYR